MLSYISDTILKKNLYIAVVLLMLGLCLKSVYLIASPIWRVDLFYYLEAVRTMFEGGVLYKNFGCSHPPFCYFTFYGLAKIAGYHNMFAAIKVSSILLDWACAFTVFAIFKDIYDRHAGFLMACVYLFLINVHPEFWAFNIPLLYLFPVLLSIYVLLRNDCELSPASLFIAGFLIACATLLSTNVVFYSLLIPMLSVLKKRSFRSFVIDGAISFAGFLFPFFFCFIYFYRNDALSDWYFWNIVWGATYNAAYPLLFKIALSLGSFSRIVSWYPFLIGWILTLCVIFRNKLFKSSFQAKIVLMIALCAFFSRIIMGKTAVRYELYFLPAILFSTGFILFSMKVHFSKIASSCIVLFCIITASWSYFLAAFQNDSPLIAKNATVRNWITEYTKPSDKIYIWNEGYDIYYLTDRKMATRFFSAEEDLDKVKLWKANGYMNTEVLWNMFLSDMDKERPAYIIDLTLHFSQSNDTEREGIHKIKYDEFMTWISQNYTFVKMGQLQYIPSRADKFVNKIHDLLLIGNHQARKENENEVFRVFIRKDLAENRSPVNTL